MKRVLLGLSLLSMSAFAGVDGGNGSDQSGKSIPLSLDRGVKIEVLEVIVEKCMQKQGKDLMEFLGLRKIECKNYYLNGMKNSEYLLKAACDLNGPRDDSLVSKAHLFKAIQDGYHWLKDHKEDKFLTFFFKKNDSEGTESILHARGSNKAPYISFTLFYPNREVDVFGRVIPNDAFAKDISIENLSDLITFENINSGEKVAYSFDSKSYEECLEREIYESMD